MPLQVLIPFLMVFMTVGIAVLAVWLFVAWRVERRRKFLERRMGMDADDGAPLIIPPNPTGWSARFDRAFQSMIERARVDLDPLPATGIILLTGVLFAAVVFVWRLEEEPWLALPAFLFGSGAALLFFWWRNRAWRRVIRNQLPDTFFLLARALRAGRSLEQAFQLISEQGVVPISREFARMYRQTELGMGVATVLDSAAQRLQIVDFNVFAAILSLHRPAGGNLPSVLDRLANATRERIHFEGQYRAATVMGRVSAGFILLLVGVILTYFFFYERDLMMRFFETGTGIMLFIAALVLEALGGVLLYWLLRFDV